MSYFEDFEEYRIGSLEYEDLPDVSPRKHYVFEGLTNKWKTREGVVLELKDMTKSHLINSLNMILRICKRENLKPNSYKIYNNLKRELKKR